MAASIAMWLRHADVIWDAGRITSRCRGATNRRPCHAAWCNMVWM